MRLICLTCLICLVGLHGKAEPFDLSPEALAFCLDQSATIERLDVEISALTDRKKALRRPMEETRLRLTTLRQTALIDEKVATRYRALALEWDRIVRAYREADRSLTETLSQRLDAGRVFESHCAGRSYTPDTLKEAEALRQAIEG